MGTSIWFDGLGSAILGGATSAIVAVGVTRSQLNHDRKQRQDVARDDATDAVLGLLAELRPLAARDGVTQNEVAKLRALKIDLIKALVLVERAAGKDIELRAWTRSFRERLEIEVQVPRNGTNVPAARWTAAMAAQIVPRLESRSAQLVDHERPPWSKSS